MNKRLVLASVLCIALLSAARADTEQAGRFYAARKYEQAAAAYVEAAASLDGKPRADALYRAGLSYRYWGRYEQAIAQMQAVIDAGDADDHTRAAAHLSIGYCHYVQSQFEPAEKQFNLVLEDKTASPGTRVDAALYTAYMYNKQGRIDDAVTVLERGYAETEAAPHSRAQTQIAAGQILQHVKRYDAARAAFQRALDTPGNIGQLKIKAETKIAEIEVALAPDDPFYIAPFITAVSQTTARIAWVSKGAFDAGAVTVGDRAVKVDARQLPAEGFWLYAVVVDGLSPDATCRYTVELGGQSRDGAFNTERTRGGAFRFSILGDTQTGVPAHTGVAKNIAEHKPDFVILVGDLVERGTNWPDWRSQFFGPGNAYLPDTVFYAVRGNHDGGPYFPMLFGFDTQQHYSFDHGNLHVIVLDAFGPGAGGKKREQQVAWLKADLEANDKPWTIVCLHDPMVGIDATNHWYGEQDYLPLILEHEVDMVFAGHHHLYRRFLPIALPGKKPTINITTGGAGGGMGGNMPSPILVKGELIHHHLDFTLDGDALHMRAVAIDGSTLDELTLIKKDGRYQDDVMAQTVEYKLARNITSLFYELGHPTADRIIPAKRDGDTLVINTAAVPRGGLNPANYPPDTDVIINDQAMPLAAGVLRFTAPRQTTINLRIGDRTFVPQDVVIAPQ